MRKEKPEFPKNRDLSPLEEKEVLKIIHNTDEFNEMAPVMTDAEFLADLYRIVDVLGGESIIPTSKVIQVLRLRANREGYSFKYTKAAVINRNRNGTLYALTKKEQLEHMNGQTTKELMFSLRDVLSVQLGRWPAGRKRRHVPLKFSRPGRPSDAMRKEMEKKKRE